MENEKVWARDGRTGSFSSYFKKIISVEASLGGMSGNISFIYVLEIVTF